MHSDPLDKTKTKAMTTLKAYLSEVNAHRAFFNLEPIILNSRTDQKELYDHLMWCLDQEQSENPYEMGAIAHLYQVKSSMLDLYSHLETPKKPNGGVLQ